MKNLTILFFGMFCSTHLAFSANLSPSSVKIKVSAAYVSTSADCSNAIQVMSDSDPQYRNMVGGVRLGQAAIPPGIYPCVILKMSDHIKVTPSGTSGPCTDGVEFTQDLCRANAGSGGDVTREPGASSNTSCTGTAQVGSGISEDWVYLYLSTAVSGTSGNSFLPPSGTSNGVRLTNAFEIDPGSVGRMTVNFDNKIITSGSNCECDAPTFGFRNE